MSKTVQTIYHEPAQAETLTAASMPSADGFNAAEFSISPLSQRTAHMAGESIRHEWVQQRDGVDHDCFFQMDYGKTAPNSQTEDVLLVLAHLANQSDDPLSVEVSLYELTRLQGAKSVANQHEINRVVGHLDALMRTVIDTNAVFDRERGEWIGVTTNIVSGYTYKDEDGAVLTRSVQVVGDDGEVHRVTKTVRELREVNLSKQFYKHFLKDSIPFDLGTYFSLGLPTAKRVYRFGNKYVQTFGSHSLDLQLFCLSRIGMSPSYVEKYKKPSLLASKLRPAVARVNETGHMHVRVERSTRAPSGYLVHFDQPVKQLPLLNVGESFTKAEEKAHALLRRQGLYPNVAHRVIVRCRQAFGRDAAAYVRFVVRRFNDDWIKSGKLKVPAGKAGGVLKRAFDDDWYYPHYIEHRASNEKREWKDEAKRYEGAPQDFAEVAAKARPELNIQSTRFSLDTFKTTHAETYAAINTAIERKYLAGPPAEGVSFSPYQLKEMADRALVLYCKQCHEAFERGDTDFFPEPLRDKE